MSENIERSSDDILNQIADKASVSVKTDNETKKKTDLDNLVAKLEKTKIFEGMTIDHAFVAHYFPKTFRKVGRRKRAVAVANANEDGKIIINNRDASDFFKTDLLIHKMMRPLNVLGYNGGFTIKVLGGGISAQSEAISLAISRILSTYSPVAHKILKGFKLLTRDYRRVERKIPGHKKSRKLGCFPKR